MPVPAKKTGQAAPVADQLRRAIAEYDIVDPDDSQEPPASASAPALSAPATAPLSAAQQPAPVVESPPGKAISQALVREARIMGLTREDIAEFTTDRQLEVFLDRLTAERSEGRIRSASSAVNRFPEEGQAGQIGEEAIKLDWGTHTEEGVTRTYIDGDMHPAIVKVFQDMVRSNRELQKRIEQLENNVRNQANRETSNRIDRAFARLAESHGDLLGVGNLDELDHDGDEVKRRKAVLNMADQMAKTDQMFQRRPRTLEEYVESATKALFPPDQVVRRGPRQQANVGLESSELESRRQQWDNGGVRQPTNREPVEEPHGRERATRNLANRLASLNGIGAYTTEDEEF